MYFILDTSVSKSNGRSPNRHIVQKYLKSGMSPDEALDAVWRSDWGRILATLIRLTGDFELAEDAVQEAFTAAVEQWRTSEIPESPRAWIIQTARHKAIDRIRRRSRFEERLESYAATRSIEETDYETAEIPDDRLRLIFTC